MTQRRTYSDEEKSAAVGRVLSGERVVLVAAALDIPTETLKAWMYRGKQAVALVATKSKKEQFGEMILDYCAAGLSGLKTQADVLNDPAFLRSKEGQIFAVAQAHRLLGDQLARYLSAIDFGND